MSFCWTIGSAQDRISLSSAGEFGLTNDVADAFGASVCKIEGKAGQSAEAAELKAGGKIRLIATTYAGDTEEQDGTIFAVKKYEDHAEVIAAYEEVERVTLYARFPRGLSEAGREKRRLQIYRRRRHFRRARFGGGNRDCGKKKERVISGKSGKT